jgi:oligopeptide transport system substrate-binding protein
MHISKRFFSGTLLLSLLVFSSCSKGAKSEVSRASAQEITINIGADPASIDPRTVTLLGDFNVIRALNEGLFRINKEGVTSTAIAQSYTVSDDGKTYTIQLKETLWSNGDPLTAHDFIYSWKSSLNKNFPSSNASFLYPLKNSKEIKEGLLPESMLGAHADGDYKIVIELKSPMPFFLELLSMPIYFPINKSVDSQHVTRNPSSKNYVCNGPFQIASWKPKNEIVVIKNKRYWDKQNVRLQKVTMIMLDDNTAFNLYQNKELHLVGSPFSKIPVESLEALSEKNTPKKQNLLGTYWIKTNTRVHPLQNKDFRKSLASSINRKEIIEHLLLNNAEIATGAVPVSMGLQESPYFKDGDIKTALSFLEKACKKLSISAKMLPELTLSYIGREDNSKIAAAIQDGWKKYLGITVKLEPLERKVYLDRISRGEYQLACASWIADFNDPINFLEVFKTKSVGTNNTGWESLDYISAINASYDNTGQISRRESLITAEKILLEDMPMIPVYHTTMLYMQDEHLKDIVLTETGNLDFKWAYLSDK